jgi:long-chain acyl-CoA synthetase
MLLTNSDNAAAILFRQAARPERHHRPRFMIRQHGNWSAVTWGEYAGRVERLAAFLMERGVDEGMKVAVLSATRLEWGIAGMATLAAKGMLVPIYPSLTAAQLAHILGHSEAQVLLVENVALLTKVLQVWPQTRLKTVIVFDPLEATAQASEASLPLAQLEEGGFVSLFQAEARGGALLQSNPRRVQQRVESITMQDVAYLIYTSGTTGLPKGVMLSHLNVGSNGAAWVEVNGPQVHDSDVDLLWLPLSHIFGWGELCLGNQLGFVTYLSEPASVLTDLAAIRPHVFMSVPAYWEKLAQLSQAGHLEEEQQFAALQQLSGGRLQFCLSGGAGLRREVKEFFWRAGIFIVEGYGLTECSPTLTMNRRDDFDFSSVGKPLSNVTLRLAADGEILAKGPNVFVGYYKDEAATRAIFDQEGWLHTGDVGRFTERGFLQIVGRKKDFLVTSGGKNIPPQNIESLFRDDPLLAFVVVYGDGKKYLTAMVDINEGVARQRLEQSGFRVEGGVRQHPQVTQWVQERLDATSTQLASYESIKRFCIAPEPFTLENDLITPSMKVKRAKVYQTYREIFEAMY